MWTQTALAGTPAQVFAPPPPSFQAYDDLAIGIFRSAVSDGPGAGWAGLSGVPAGFEAHWRQVQTQRPIVGAAFELEQRLRAHRDPQGRVVVDELTVGTRVVRLEILPAAGDLLSVSLVGGRWNQGWWAARTRRAQLLLFTPLRLTALGLSDATHDSDTRLKAFAAGGAGLGADATVEVGAGVGVHARIQGGGEAMIRHRGRQRPAATRLGTRWRAELGLATLSHVATTTFGAYIEGQTQWEPGIDPEGVDRQSFTAGFRFATRVSRRAPPPPAPLPAASAPATRDDAPPQEPAPPVDEAPLPFEAPEPAGEEPSETTTPPAERQPPRSPTGPPED